jgi:hypothetical protein
MNIEELTLSPGLPQEAAKPQGIERKAMDIEESLPRLGLRDRLRMSWRRRFRKVPAIDQSYESNPTLETDFLEEKYLRILHGFGYELGQLLRQGTYGMVAECFFIEDTNIIDDKFGDYVLMTRKPVKDCHS